MTAKQTKGAGASKAGGTASAVTVGILVRAVTDGLAAQPKAVCPRFSIASYFDLFPAHGRSPLVRVQVQQAVGHRCPAQ